MVDDDDSADAAARLESALERIAELARRRAQEVAMRGESDDTGAGGSADTGGTVDTGAIAGRLDTLIARLRDVLDT